MEASDVFASNSSTLEQYKPVISAIVMWALLISGVILVGNASNIALAYVSKVQLGGPTHSYMWNTEEQKEIANTVKLLGFMAFSAGLVERLAIAIAATVRKLKI